MENQHPFNFDNSATNETIESDLTLQEINEILKQLPKILKQMKNIVISSQQNISSIQAEISLIKDELSSIKNEQEKFRANVTQAFNIFSEKISGIQKVENDINLLDQILGKRLADLEDELVLTQQMATKGLNEVLKFKEHWKI